MKFQLDISVNINKYCNSYAVCHTGNKAGKTNCEMMIGNYNYFMKRFLNKVANSVILLYRVVD